MLPKLDMKNYVYGTRVIKDDLTSNHQRYNPRTNKSYPFKWTLKKYEWHNAIDWKKTKECGHGLHFWKDGEGNYDATTIGNSSIWLLVRAKKDEVVDLNRKAKAKALQVLDWGDAVYINNLMSKLKPEAQVNFATYNKYSQGKIVGGHYVSVNKQDCSFVNINVLDNAVIYAGYGARVKCGVECMIVASGNSKIDCGDYGFVKLLDRFSKIKAGYRTKILVDNCLIQIPSHLNNIWLSINCKNQLQECEE